MFPPNALVRLDRLSIQSKDATTIGDYLKGYLIDPPQIGHTLRVRRTERSAQKSGEIEPVKVEGWYTSGLVQDILEKDDGSAIIKTSHSRWKVTLV